MSDHTSEFDMRKLKESLPERDTRPRFCEFQRPHYTMEDHLKYMQARLCKHLVSLLKRYGQMHGKRHIIVDLDSEECTIETVE